MPLEDFEIVSCISKNAFSSVYKVVHKKSRKIYVWRTVSSAELSEKNVQELEDHVKLQKCVKHPHLLRFYDIFKDSPEKFYIVTEYCENGSLDDLIGNALKKNLYFSEEFLSRILYQIAFTLKTIDCFAGKLLPKEIFFDDKFNVKLSNFSYGCNKMMELRMQDLGRTVLQACTRKLNDHDNLDCELTNFRKLYSHSIVTTIMHMINDNGDLKANVNNVLCHPTILLKSSNWSKEKSFLRVDLTLEKYNKAENEKYGTTFLNKMEKLRSKEIALQKREQKLDEREHKLLIRERKIATQERIIKQKMHRAELYSAKSEISKSILIGACRSECDENIPKNLDSTYVSCGDSVILPTSKKLDVKEIVKPPSFTRTLSERRIRFKGHSPLKDMDFNKKIVKPPKPYRESVDSSEWLTCSEEYDKLAGSAEGNCKSKKGKNLFQMLKQSSVGSNINTDINCKTNIWTEENKKQAFELLRLMNGKENMSDNVKHTYL